MHNEIEDGMGLAGLVASPVERRAQQARERELAAARSTLAQKVLETVEAQTIDPNFSGHWVSGFADAKSEIRDALRELFQREGIEVR